MRIIHAHKYFHDRDGAGKYLFALMHRQHDAGHTVVPFAMQHPLNAPTPWATYFVHEMQTAHAAWGPGALAQLGRALWSPASARAMRRLLRDVSPDVVHAHNIYTHLSPSILRECAERDVPVVMTVHDYALVSANYALWNRDHRLTRRSLCDIAASRFNKGWLPTLALELVTRLQRNLGLYDRYIDRYIVPSSFVADVLTAAGYPAAKMVILPPFVEPPVVPVECARTHVLFVGRLERYKGAETAVLAMRDMQHERLLVVGDGPDRARLAQLAHDIPNVQFAGFLSGAALASAYAQAKALVVPSLWDEPFGLVALEAMWRGIPVVVSDRGSLPSIVDDGAAGLVFAAGNEVALGNRLRQIAEDPVFAADLGQRGKKRAGELADPAEHVGRILALYRDVEG